MVKEFTIYNSFSFSSHFDLLERTPKDNPYNCEFIQKFHNFFFHCYRTTKNIGLTFILINYTFHRWLLFLHRFVTRLWLMILSLHCIRIYVASVYVDLYSTNVFSFYSTRKYFLPFMELRPRVLNFMRLSKLEK